MQIEAHMYKALKYLRSRLDPCLLYTSGDFDAEKALAACVATANLDNYRGIGLYKKLGYIPVSYTHLN